MGKNDKGTKKKKNIVFFRYVCSRVSKVNEGGDDSSSREDVRKNQINLDTNFARILNML